MRVRRWLAGIAAAMLVTGALGACGGDDDDATADTNGSETTAAQEGEGGLPNGVGITDDEIRVGFHGPLTGPVSWVGLGARDGLELAFAEINADGGVNGRNLVLDVKDDEGSPATAGSIVREYVQGGDTAIVVSAGLSVPTVGGVVAARETGIPYFNLTAGDPKAHEPFAENVFHGMALQAPWTGRASVTYLVEKYDASRVGYMHSEDGFNTAMLDGVREGAEEIGDVEVVGVTTWKPGDTDFTAQALRMAEADPDVVMVATLLPEAAPVVKALRAAGVTAPLLISNGGTGESMLELSDDELGDGVLGTWFFSDYFSAESGPVADFMAAWTEEYGSGMEGRPNYVDVNGYVDGYTLAEAFGNMTEATPEALIAALEGISDFNPTGISARSYSSTKHFGGTGLNVLEVVDGSWKSTGDTLDLSFLE